MTAPLRLWPADFEVHRAEARAAVEAGMTLFSRPEAEVGMTREERVRFQRETMPVVPSDAGCDEHIASVRCRVFTPPDGVPARAVYVHFHGGGMVAGTPELMDIPNEMLARDLGVAIVSADYRKAPEHPWPAGPDDAWAVTAWIAEHGAERFGTDRVVIGGESAGGYLAALTGLRLRDRMPDAAPRVLGLNLVFGVFDWGRTPSQRGTRPHDGPDLLSPEGIAFVADCYLPGMNDDERRAPEISPAYADLRQLPPIFVSVGTCDHLLDDSLLLATRAAAAGVDVELFVAPDMPHGFFAFPCTLTNLWAEHFNGWMARVIDGA